MRLLSFLLSGVLLYTAVLLLTSLFAQPPYHWVGATAAAVFLPLWYLLSAVNARKGIASGYGLGLELAVFTAAFGGPAALALSTWWISTTRWEGGPVITTGRTPVILAAGIAMWTATVLLTGLLSPTAPAVTATAFFLPLWLLVAVANGLVGVIAAGYTPAEEAPVLLVNFSVPAAAAASWVAPWRAARRSRT
ncbi:hypothetical protein [Streptomyces prunicolor]|uniref:Integral membrane protein n=1 Tax=Streptomyces prunicolor TaxID=67348 RepID=A0ABU4F897_9ACTN|nr:hypothetical protein [Streptomyces prunicolor]MDV7216812.1 hypothetical protein [Streptomyces prunicolor]